MTIPKVRTGVKIFLDLPRTVQVIIEGIWGNPQASGYIAEDDVTFNDGECKLLPATANVVKGVCTLQLRPRQLRLEEHQHGGDFRLEDGHPHQAPGQPPRQDVRSSSGLRLLRQYC